MTVTTIWGAESIRCERLHAFVGADVLPVCGRGARRESIVVPRLFAEDRKCKRCLESVSARVRRREREEDLRDAARVVGVFSGCAYPPKIVPGGVLVEDSTFKRLAALVSQPKSPDGAEVQA